MKPELWKTAAAAIVLTVTFAVLVTAFNRWTGESFVDTWIIPQIPVGSADGNRTDYMSVIQIRNTGSNPIRIKGRFYKADGGTSDVRYNANLPKATIEGDGLLHEGVLPGNATLVLTSSVPPLSAYKSNWAKIEATGNISVDMKLEHLSANNSQMLPVSLPASRSMSKFVIERVHNVESGTDVAFAIANAGSSPAAVTATLRDATGAVVAAQTLNIAAGAQIAQFIGELFPLVPEPQTSHGFVTFDGGPSAQLGAIAISYPTQVRVDVTPLP